MNGHYGHLNLLGNGWLDDDENNCFTGSSSSRSVAKKTFLEEALEGGSVSRRQKFRHNQLRTLPNNNNNKNNNSSVTTITSTNYNTSSNLSSCPQQHEGLLMDDDDDLYEVGHFVAINDELMMCNYDVVV